MSDEMTPDGRAIRDAITNGWVSRGFKLGVGFWLAGLFAFFVALLVTTVVMGGMFAAWQANAPEVEESPGLSGIMP